jgi:ankyrin repeat protein
VPSVNQLNRAIRGDDVPHALALIASGAWLDSCDTDCFDTPLCAAVRAKAEPVVTALLAAGAGLEVPNRHGDRPLHCACRIGSEPMARLLIDAGADVNARITHDPNNIDSGQTPLIAALYGRSQSVVALLLARGADPLIADDHGRGPMVYAQHGGKRIADLIAKAIAASAEASGLSAHDAARTKALGRLRTLAREGAALDQPEGDEDNTLLAGQTPLHIAADFGWVEGVEFLLGQGISPDIRSRHGLTPLMMLHTGKPALAVARALLAAGADPDALSPRGHCPLLAASDAALVEVLLEAGADPDLRDPQTGATVFLDTCLTAAAPVITAMVAAGADLDAVDNAGRGTAFYAKSNHRARAAIAQAKGTPPSPADLMRAALKQLPARAADPRFQAYAQALGAAFNRNPAPWKRRKGALYFHDVSLARIHANLGEGVPEGEDQRRHDQALARLAAEARDAGAVLFHLDHDDPARRPLVLLPIAEPLAPLIACGTNANARGDSGFVFNGMQAIAASDPLDIYACGFDFLRAQLRAAPQDAAAIAERLIALCPDAGDPGNPEAAVAAFAEELAATGRFTLWWD